MSQLLYITILAGGSGKRMNSHLPKVLHLVNGEPMIVSLIKKMALLNPYKLLIVVGAAADMIREEISIRIMDPAILGLLVYVKQHTPLGTGHAVKVTLPQMQETGNAINLILNGDVPMIQTETIRDIYKYYLQTESELLITAIRLQNPTGNGRIIISDDKFQSIREERDCSATEKNINLVNCGIYICNYDVLCTFIPKIDNTNSQQEYYVTDLVKLYSAESDKVIGLYVLPDEKEIEIYNINTKEQLEYANGRSVQ